MKIAIVGSRTFNKYSLLENYLNDNFNKEKINEIVSGGAKGADQLAEIYAEKNNIPIKVFHPNWDKYGKSAGFIRNKDIVNYADIVIAFWDGKSKGTKHDIDLAKKAKKKCFIVTFDN